MQPGEQLQHPDHRGRDPEPDQQLPADAGPGHQADQAAQRGEVEGGAGAGQAPQHQPRASRGGQEADRLGQAVEEGETGEVSAGTIPIFDAYACLQ